MTNVITESLEASRWTGVRWLVGVTTGIVDVTAGNGASGIFKTNASYDPELV
jgi:hypothetical protein